MSADNWAICPCCLKQARHDALLLRLEMDDKYGKIPLDEFDELRKRAETPIDEDGLRTFREDYEIYGAEEGVLHVSYGGHCKECGTSLKLSEEYPFFPSTEEAQGA